MYYKYSTLTGKHEGARSCLSTCDFLATGLSGQSSMPPLKQPHFGGQTMSRCSENPKYHVDYPISVCLIFVSQLSLLFALLQEPTHSVSGARCASRGNPITRTTWTFWSGPCCCAHLGAPRETARDGNGWMGLNGLEAHVFSCFIQFDCPFNK